MKIGFCCKWIDNTDQILGFKPKDEAKVLNTRVTTVRWLNEHKSEAEARLWDLMVHNIESIRLLVERVGKLDESLRMVRIGSDILPCYTEPTWGHYWTRTDVRDYCAKHLGIVGHSARNSGVRLSFHPGQFCVLSSDSDSIIDRSIAEFEYHADLARWMGYGQTWHDHGFKINVHIAGKRGAEGIKAVLPRLSTEARNLITIENDETRHGLDASLELVDHVALVLDIHHHWVRTGEYIEPTDDRVKRVIDSWRGTRPVIHYSLSREDELGADVIRARNVRPDLASLLQIGYKKSKLRAHSDFMWNEACNAWALSFGQDFDIQVESKAKNLASFKLYDQAKKLGL
jgi:UV DNA damage repair endonuclease